MQIKSIVKIKKQIFRPMKVFKENAGKEVNEVNKDVNRLMSNKSNNANLFNELQKNR